MPIFRPKGHTPRRGKETGPGSRLDQEKIGSVLTLGPFENFSIGSVVTRRLARGGIDPSAPGIVDAAIGNSSVFSEQELLKYSGSATITGYLDYQVRFHRPLPPKKIGAVLSLFSALDGYTVSIVNINTANTFPSKVDETVVSGAKSADRAYKLIKKQRLVVIVKDPTSGELRPGFK